MSNQIVPAVQPQTPAAKDTATVDFEIVEGFVIQISSRSHRIVKPLEANKAGTVRVGFLPIKSKSAPNDVCRELNCGQADAKRAIKKAKREIGFAWVASMTAGLKSDLLFRAGTVGKSGAIGVVFDSADSDDSGAVASAEAKLADAEAKLAELEAKLAGMAKA